MITIILDEEMMGVIIKLLQLTDSCEVFIHSVLTSMLVTGVTHITCVRKRIYTIKNEIAEKECQK